MWPGRRSEIRTAVQRLHDFLVRGRVVRSDENDAQSLPRRAGGAATAVDVQLETRHQNKQTNNTNKQNKSVS